MELGYINWNIVLGDFLPIIVSGIAIWIAIKNRRSNLRENIYDRQVDAVLEIHKAIVVIDHLIEDLSIEDEDKKKVDLMDQIDDAYLEAHNAVDNVEILLDTDLYIETIKFLGNLDDILKQVREAGDYKFNTADVSDLFFEVEEDFRDFLGIDRLTEENRNITK